MTPSPSAAPAAAMPTYADTILSVLIAGAGAPLVTHHILTAPQLHDVTGALLVLVGVGWAVINANPNRSSPIAFLLGLVRAAGPAAGPWDQAVAQLEQSLIGKLTPIIHAEVKAHAGILAGPVDALADKALRQAADKAAAALEPDRVPVTVDAVRAAVSAHLYPTA